MSKIKVLFVVGSLCRAGAERFAYEIDCALSKNKFQTTVFCREFEEEITVNWDERYYEKKHKDLETPIIYNDKFIKRNKSFFNKVKNFILKKLKISVTKKKNFKLISFLESFDVIHWM